MSTVLLSKTFLFQAIQFSQTVLIQTIQFSISIVFVHTQLNIKTILFQSTQFSSVWPIDRTLSSATTLNLGVIAMKGNSAFPKPHHQIV